MQLPHHIRTKIELLVAATPKTGGHIDNEAARHDGIALFGTIGSVWLLRSDGTVWDVDEDSGRAPQELPPELRLAAVVVGADRHPWLAALQPARPPEAITCTVCSGRGRLFPVNASGFLYCMGCRALGWTTA